MTNRSKAGHHITPMLPTFVLRSELLHLRGQRLIEALLTGDEGLADGVVVIAHHAGVSAHLVHKGLQRHTSRAQPRGHNLLLCLGLLLLLLRCLTLAVATTVLSRLHAVRDAHGVRGP